jgi:hypothetical protein
MILPHRVDGAPGEKQYPAANSGQFVLASGRRVPDQRAIDQVLKDWFLGCGDVARIVPVFHFVVALAVTENDVLVDCEVEDLLQGLRGPLRNDGNLLNGVGAGETDKLVDLLRSWDKTRVCK